MAKFILDKVDLDWNKKTASFSINFKALSEILESLERSEKDAEWTDLAKRWAPEYGTPSPESLDKFIRTIILQRDQLVFELKELRDANTKVDASLTSTLVKISKKFEI